MQRSIPGARQTPWAWAVLWLGFALVAAASAVAQPPGRELLNSERIAATFGSYGVEVLEASETIRTSSLYSGTSDTRICRTFAVVRYLGAIDPAITTEHAAIAAGGSIGAVFAANGWRVRKTHLHYGEQRATAALARRMRIAEGMALAEHAYVLDVEKAGQVIQYAALIEIHHPDYLRRDELASIYGQAAPGARPEVLAALLEAAATHVAR